MSLMNDLTQYIGLQKADSEQQNSGFSQFGQMLGMEAKRREDEKRRVENVKKQMSEAQQKMQAMSQMSNNSASAKVVGSLDDDAQKRRKGIIEVSDYLPQQEMTVDETGALNIKIGQRRATPQEQAAQYEMGKKQMEVEKGQAKSELMNAYIKGDIQEGAILKEMGGLGITPDEFDMATQARERFRQISQQQTFSGQPTQIPSVGKSQADTTEYRGVPQQWEQEQPFRFNPKEPKPPTMAQETTGLYAGRIKQANEVFDSMEEYLNDMPIVGTAMSKIVPNWAKDGKFQAYDQAKRNFLNAVLRRESGAVISPSEFVSGDQQYFPQPGDKPEVLSQKKANRDLVMKNFIKSAGSAYVEYEDPLANKETGGDVRSQYNALRESGVSAEQAKAQLGL